MGTPNKQSVSKGKKTFWKAVRILQNRALTDKELEETYASLKHIHAYLPTLSDKECVRVENMLGERAGTFKIFLASQPPDEPNDNPDIPEWLIKERQKNEQRLDALWSSWKSGLILEELSRVFARENMGKFDTESWLRNAQKFFTSFEHVDVKVDIVAGYGSTIDRLLLDTKDFQNTYVLVRGDLEEPTIQGPEIREHNIFFIAKGIQWRSGINSELSILFAQAISLSLPAHNTILDSRLDVILDERGCVLVSNWKNPFEKLGK
ncbi:MAG: hypothetical protein Greene07144_358 [Parcubacteria group bacterium Greene0714_4]|nr:MAG: hypothetical protein Greene07144_358 [Parcubacteria group bacterium Greene0714_4]